jgi:hypothetical protein
MKFLNPSCKIPWQLPKLLQHKRFYAVVSIVPLSVLGLILWNSTRSKPKLTNQWQPGSQISNLADINLVIDTYINLSGEVTWESVAEKLTATKVGSIVVYQFNLPDTCGFAGCLYVMSDGYAKSQALQLWDEPYFEIGSQPECLKVEQRGKKYEICL